MLADYACKGIGQLEIHMVQGNGDSDAVGQSHDGSSLIVREASVPAGMTAMGPETVNDMIAALKRGRSADQALMVTSFVAVSAPQFVVSLLLLYVFAVQLGWFPIGGYGTFAHLVLPAITLGIMGSGWYSRMMRSSMIDVLQQDFIRTARAKGLTRRRVILRHALPNAILPVIAMIGIDIGIFMGGLVVVESVFGWPGIGQLAWQAIQRVDIPIIMGVTPLKYPWASYVPYYFE